MVSLLCQSQKSDIILCTSTDNGYIRRLSEKYGVPLYVRNGKSSLREDWNFAVYTAVKECGAGLVTVAHQDDIYHPEYAGELMRSFRRYPDMSLFCCRYETIDAQGKKITGQAESVKRILRLPLRFRSLCGTSFIKELPLRFGNGICCPSCTYNIQLCGLPIFHGDYSFVTDWDALLRLAKRPGRFICAEKELLSYRVHSEAATSQNIKNHNREREEELIFRSLWPGFIAKLIMIPYKKSYKAYS